MQITTDGLRAYIDATEEGFGGEVDWAVLVKVYGDTVAGEARYSPPDCVGCQRHAVNGAPNAADVSTSHTGRQTLARRMRRFTRLTNGFSKKSDNLEHAVALHFFACNFITFHKSLRMPPALKAKVAHHVWSFEELVDLIDRDEIERKRNPISN